MRTEGSPRWTRERLLYLTVGVIICVVGVALILA